MPQLTRFLRYYWLSRYSFVTEKQLFRTIKRKGDEGLDYGDFLTELTNDSGLFSKLLAGNADEWSSYKSQNKIFESLNAIKLMGASQCYVLFLSIFRNQDKIGSDPSRILKLVENFTYDYSAICKLPANKLERLYSSYAVKIQNAIEKSKPKELTGDIQRLYSQLETELKKLAPGEEEFIASFMELEYGKSHDSRRLVGYTLAKLDAFGQSGELRINFDTVNIEHVLPQKPDKEWGVGRSEVKEYVNMLGNLTLVHKKINSKASNSSPQKKSEELAKSDIKMTKDVAGILQKNGNWTRDDIQKRHLQLAGIAYHKVWAL